MNQPNLFILYVTDPLKSAAFYEKILGIPPIELSETFSLFLLSSGLKLGFWSKKDVEPMATMRGGGGEICFSLPSRDAVLECFQRWSNEGISIVQPLTEMDFGFTFTALDPDQHRLRVCVVEN